MSTEQEPPVMVQVVLSTELPLANEPAPVPLMVSVTVVPFGAATKPPPRPRFWKTLAVTGSPVLLALVLTSSGACWGVRAMLASTHVFSTGRLSELIPSPVARVGETPVTLKVVLALTVVCRALLEKMVTEQVPAAVIQLVLVTVLLLENEPTPLRLRLTVVPSGAGT